MANDAGKIYSDENLRKILQICIDEDASDIHLTVGRPPTYRIHGEFQALDMPPLTADDTQGLMEKILPPDYVEEFKRVGGSDYGYTFEDKGRFRVSVFRQRTAPALVLRLLPYKVLSFEDLNLDPDVIIPLLYRPRGIILVTGPTGCGKTTTLATLIDYINRNRGVHILTIEQPIEYYHTHKKAIVNQRQVGIHGDVIEGDEDVPSFAEALSRNLRSDPDVILVGEMRDLRTMQAAITAAETGHLVFSTLHTVNAPKTIDRLVNAFPLDQQEQIKLQVSTSLVAVFAEQLLRRCDKRGRTACYEIMLNNSAIASHIRKNETYQIRSAIQVGRGQGMKTMEDSIVELYRKGWITREDALAFAFEQREVAERISEMGEPAKKTISVPPKTKAES